jgi:hypothetical protein
LMCKDICEWIYFKIEQIKIPKSIFKI